MTEWFGRLLGLVFLGSLCTSLAVASALSIAFVDPKLNVHFVSSFDDIPDSALVYGFFNDTILENGWSTLEIHAQPLKEMGSRDPAFQSSDTLLAYGAGLLEGALTSPRIAQTFRNFGTGLNLTNLTSSIPMMNYLNTQTEFLQTMYQQSVSSGNDLSYWYHVMLFGEQLKGLVDGYRLTKYHSDAEYDLTAFAWANLYFEISDIQTATSPNPSPPRSRHDRPGGCSALVRLLKDSQEMFVSHTTWTLYQTMLRVYKLYDLPFAQSGSDSSVVPGQRTSFSGYFGLLASGDDFYEIQPSLLVSLETTNSVYNTNLFPLYVVPQTVPEWIRVMVANRVASSADEWTKVFAMFNSGTYNNQWMVVDYAKYIKFNSLNDPNLALLPGTLMIAEQIPGTIDINDVTSILDSRGYWSSYNIPYSPLIFNLSLYPAKVAQFGDYYSYEQTARALIFARDVHTVIDLPSMQKIMRYNQFQTDPLSRCNCTPPYSSELTIAARSDLNPVNGTFPNADYTFAADGATDAKIASVGLIQAGVTRVISGPTSDEQPVFSWDAPTVASFPHEGQPSVFNFDWIDVAWVF